MNSKFVLGFLFIVLCSCGLKRAPQAPAGSNLPSLIDKYSKNQTYLIKAEEKKQTKDKKKK